MNNSNKIKLLVTGAIFIGIIVGLVIASNLEWTFRGLASSNGEKSEKHVVLGSNAEPLQTNINIEALDNAFVTVAENVKPSVVTISSAKIIKYRRMHPFSDFFSDDLFRHYFPD